MDKHELNEMALEVAKRILSRTPGERSNLVAIRPGPSTHVFDDLVELAKQLLREEGEKRIRGLVA